MQKTENQIGSIILLNKESVAILLIVNKNKRKKNPQELQNLRLNGINYKITTISLKFKFNKCSMCTIMTSG